MYVDSQGRLVEVDGGKKIEERPQDEDSDDEEVQNITRGVATMDPGRPPSGDEERDVGLPHTGPVTASRGKRPSPTQRKASLGQHTGNEKMGQGTNRNEKELDERMYIHSDGE